MFVTQCSQSLKKSFNGRNAAHVARDRLDEDGRHIRSVFLHEGFHCSQVIEGGNQGQVGSGLGNTRARRMAMGCCTGSCGHKERIPVSVVAAFKLDEE